MKNFTALIYFLILSVLIPGSLVFASQAQPVPIPEDQSTAPQIDILGVGIGTLGYARTGDHDPEAGIDFSDSAIQIGASERLLEIGGIGNFSLGGLMTDQANRSANNQTNFFIHQAFVDIQTESYEALVGRSDNETAHLTDFPTLRGEDLLDLTNPLNPFSNGQNFEEHRYANVASGTYNQNLTYFENIHVQHLINSANIGTNAGINSIGATFQYMGPPGLEAFSKIPLWGCGYEHLLLNNQTTNGLDQFYFGGVINLTQGVKTRFDFRFQDTMSIGNRLTAFQSVTDTYQADSNALAFALRYLYSPFGRPGYQIALTGGYKNYFNVGGSRAIGGAVTGVKRVGSGLDLVAQVKGEWRDSLLAAAQVNGVGNEYTGEIGFIFNFDASFNQHIMPRRTLLNQQHQYIPF
jgi:hypothetical protein